MQPIVLAFQAFCLETFTFWFSSFDMLMRLRSLLGQDNACRLRFSVWCNGASSLMKGLDLLPHRGLKCFRKISSAFRQLHST